MARRRAWLPAILVFLPTVLGAASGTPAWLTPFSPQAPGTGGQDPLGARALADGTTMVAVHDKSGITCLRYDAGGSPVSSATISPPFAPVALAISALGEIFVLAQAPTHSGDFWTMKYEGVGGRAAWPAPAVFDGAGSRTDNPVAIAVDDVGDVYVTGAAHSGTDYDWATLKYAGESGSVLWGPVPMNRSAGSADNPAILGVDPFGDVVVTGFSQAGATPYDWVTAKYSGATGAAVWGPVSFDGPDHRSDFPDALAFDAAGNVIVSGEIGRAAGDLDWATVEYAAGTGAVRWGPAIFSGAGAGDDKPAAAAVDGRGDVAVIGRTWNGSDFDWAALKYAGADGALLWGPVTLSRSASSEDYPTALVSDAAGNFIAAGDTLGLNYNWMTAAFAGSNGAVLWGPKIYSGLGGGDDFPRALVLDRAGNAVVTGAAWNGVDTDAITIAYSGATGATAWGPQTFAGAGAVGASDSRMARDATGNVFVAGTQGGLTDGASDVDWFVAKYDGATGALLWGPVRFDGATHEEDRVVAVAVDPSGNAIVTGTTSHAGNFDWATIKYDGSNGGVLWGPVTFDGGGGSIDLPVGLAVDPAGDATITGYSYGGSLGGSPTVKYSGATGAVVWGPMLYDGTPAAIAASATGDAFVTGSTFNGSDDDWATFEYKSSDGSVLWGPVVYAGAVAGSSDTPVALAVTPAGNLLVAGIQSGPAGPGDFDWVTLEYDGASGNLLWGPNTVGGNAARRDVPAAVVSDSSGNAYVTGGVINLATAPAGEAPGFIDVNPDWATVKYDGTTGATVWGPIGHDGFAHLFDAATALAVDASGNAIVAGVVTGPSGTFDDELVKYRASDGFALWRGSGFDGGGADQPTALVALGADAIVTGMTGAAVTTMRFTEALAIATLSLPSAACGEAYDVTLIAANGAPPYGWTVVSGALPGGLTMSADGHITGSPLSTGAFAFTARASDAASGVADRDFSIDVFPGAGIAVAATADPVCPGGSSDLSVSGDFASYLWLPDGETTPTITVSPTEAATYGVVVTDSTGCERRGSRVVGVGIADAPAPVVTADACVPAATGGLAASTPAHACNTYAWTIAGGTIDSGQGTNAITYTSGPPGTLVTLGVTETNSLGASASAGALVQASFADVPPGGTFYAYICTIARNGVTAGCGGGNYCPDASVTRAQMAVFLLKSEHGAAFVPPPCTGVFADVPCPGGFAADWIEQLHAEGVTSGCGGGNYCPDAPVTRAQMAVFLLKTHLGSSYVPPAASGIFGDVPVGSFAADWIEDLYGRGITGGCQASPLLYCPNNPNTRGQMAVFLTKTFGLQ